MPSFFVLLVDPVKETQHFCGDLRAVFFEGEVAGVEKVELDILQITLVGMGTICWKNMVVLAPDD